MEKFMLNSLTSQALVSPSELWCKESAFGVVSTTYHMNTIVGTPDWDDQPARLYVAYYQFNQWGTAYHCDVPISDSTRNDVRNLIVGVLPANLEASSTILQRPSTHTGWDKYKYFFADQYGTRLSSEYTVNSVPECETHVQLGFWNSYGGWEYVFFYGRQTNRDDIQKKSYTVNRGNWTNAEASNPYTLSGVMSNRKITSSKKTRLRTLRTSPSRPVTEVQLSDLINSENVVEVIGSKVIPVIVKTSSLDYSNDISDRMKIYEIKVEYAVPYARPSAL